MKNFWTRSLSAMRRDARQKTKALTPKWRVLRTHFIPWTVAEVNLENEPQRESVKVEHYPMAMLGVTFMTLVLWATRHFLVLENIAILYLVPVLITAWFWGLGPSILSAAMSVLAFDYFFVPPAFALVIHDVRDLLSFAVFIAVAVLTARMASKLREQAREARHREEITSSLYALSRQMAKVSGLDSLLDQLARHVFETFNVPVMLALPDDYNQVLLRAAYPSPELYGGINPEVLKWVYQHGQKVGFGEKGRIEVLCVPLKTEKEVHGVMCLGQYGQGMGFGAERLRIIEALAGLGAISIARIHYEEAAKVAHLTAESERLRTALLDSISHELRTPLSTIMGSVTGMLEGIDVLSSQDQRELLLTMREGSMRMNRLITNLLGMVRIESGMLRLNRRPNELSDIIGVAIHQVREALQNRQISVSMPDEMETIAVDDVLIEQVLVNLLSNAIKYSPDASRIHIEASLTDQILTIRIRDQGIGIQPHEAEKLFDKFYRSPRTRHIPGTGLGLAICRSIIVAHGGQITARRGALGGTVITIRLPAAAPAADSESKGVVYGPQV